MIIQLIILLVISLVASFACWSVNRKLESDKKPGRALLFWIAAFLQLGTAIICFIGSAVVIHNQINLKNYGITESEYRQHKARYISIDGSHVSVSVVSTYHLDTCDLCGRTDVSVTELRDFGYPDLRLVNWNRIKKLVKEEDE